MVASSAYKVYPVDVSLYSFTLAPATLVPSKPLVSVQEKAGDAVCVALLQLLTIISLLERHWDSPFPFSFAEIILLSNNPYTGIDHVPPEETVVEPMTVLPLNNVIVADVMEEKEDLVHVPVTENAVGEIGPLTVGASVQTGGTPVPVDFKESTVNTGCLVINVIQSAI